jgi:hypothetical protein
MPKYLVLAEGGDTYTRDGDHTHNIQALGVVEGDTPQEAFNELTAGNANWVVYPGEYTDYTLLEVSEGNEWGVEVDVLFPTDEDEEVE